MDENTTIYRYPGTKFFEAGQTNIFFGRKEETDSLVHSIKAHDIFVVFADSGIGKTSLLNAGLIPAFEKESELEKIIPVKFRFQDLSKSPLEIIAAKLSAYLDPGSPCITGKEHTLWQLFKCCHFKDSPDTKEKLPLFIFDQFEEFFNHRKYDREACINELSDLTNQYLPDFVRDEMTEKFRDRKPNEEEIKYYTVPRVKMLFLIRADKLKLLDDFSKKIPLILRNRFHLKPLNILQAKEAILFPACLPRNGFASPAFSFQEEAVKQICAYLKNEEEEVESFQLQILCQELEKRVTDRYANEKTPAAVLITEKELGGEAGMNDITKNYYVNKINAIQDPAMRSKAVELIEDKLIVDDRRNCLAEFFLLNEGYSRELLDYLLGKTRLIRIDNDGYIEISHDRLLPSILNLKRKRKEAEEKENAIQQIKEEEEKRKQLLLKKQQEDLRQMQLDYLKDKVKKAAKLRVYIIILVALLIGLLYASFSVDSAKTQANIALAKIFINQLKYDSAKMALERKSFLSLFNFPAAGALKKLNDSIDGLVKKKKLFDTVAEQANSLFNAVFAISGTVDSLFASGYQKTPAPQIINDFIDKINAGNLKLVLKLYDSANSFGISDGLTSVDVETMLKENIPESTARMLNQAGNVIQLLLKNGQKEKAKLVYRKAQEILYFAQDNYFPLGRDDTLYFHTYYNELQ